MSDRMKNVILVCALVQTVVYLGAADEKLSYDHQDGGIISVLLKKIRDLEERDREFDSKLKEIDVLKERLDAAQRRLLNMQKLEHRLQKSEEQIQILLNHVDNTNVNKSATLKVVDTIGTHGTISINSSSPFWIQRAVSSKDSRQIEMVDKIAELVSFKNCIQNAMFSFTPVSITPGRSLQFDRVDYNEGNAYDTKTGIFKYPVAGTYFLYTNIISMYRTDSRQTEIVLEGQGKGKTHAYNVDTNVQGSTAASLHCESGQRIWVRAVQGSQPYGEMLSSFTGVLMWQDDAATNSN